MRWTSKTSRKQIISFDMMTDKVKALLAYANEVTGADDKTLGDAIKRLAEGYKKHNSNNNETCITSSSMTSAQTE